jgi:hypothetical protein
VRKGTPGFIPTKIENKIALRCVQVMVAGVRGGATQSVAIDVAFNDMSADLPQLVGASIALQARIAFLIVLHIACDFRT